MRHTHTHSHTSHGGWEGFLFVWFFPGFAVGGIMLIGCLIATHPRHEPDPIPQITALPVPTTRTDTEWAAKRRELDDRKAYFVGRTASYKPGVYFNDYREDRHTRRYEVDETTGTILSVGNR